MNEKQQKISNLKAMYNNNGIEYFGNEFVRIMKKYLDIPKTKILEDLKKIHDFTIIAFMMANCQSNCFDNIENNIEVQCKCINDNIVISLKE